MSIGKYARHGATYSQLARRSKLLRPAIERLEGRVLLAGDGLAVTYWDNIDLTGRSVDATVTQVNNSWGTGSPSTFIGNDTYSVRWTGYLEAPTTGTYTLRTVADDGVRLWVNGALLIDRWTDAASPVTNDATISLTTGKKYTLQLDYYENTGSSTAQLQWITPGQSTAVAIPQASLDQPLSGGWLNQDVGSVPAAGSVSYASGAYTLTGEGMMRGGFASTDAFHDLYRPVSGDFEWTFRLSNFSVPDWGNARFGPMIRTNLTNNAEYFSAAMYQDAATSGNIRWKMLRRLKDGELSVREIPGGTTDGEYYYPSTQPVWMRVTRRGDNVGVLQSTDGVTWHLYEGQQMDLPKTVYIGVADAGGFNPCSMTVDNVSFTPLGGQDTVNTWLGNQFAGGYQSKLVGRMANAMYVNPATNQFYVAGFNEAYDGAIYDSNGNWLHSLEQHQGSAAITADANYVYAEYRSGDSTFNGFRRYRLPIGRDENSFSYLDGKLVTGLAVNTSASRLYASNYTDGTIHVFNTSQIYPTNMTQVTSWTFDATGKPGNIAVDSSGNLWIVQYESGAASGRVLKYSPIGTLLTTISFPSGTFPNQVKPRGIAIQPGTGQIWVTDCGQSLQVHRFTSGGAYVSSWGTSGGIYGGAVPGQVAPLKFNFPRSIGFDSAGNIYVASSGAVPSEGVSWEAWRGTGAEIQKYDPTGTTLLWNRNGLEFLDTGSPDASTDGLDIYTKYHHYSWDPTKAPGQEWSYVGMTYNPFAYPDLNDARRVTINERKFGTQIRTVGGVKLMFIDTKGRNGLWVYRFAPGSEIAIPTAAVSKQDPTEASAPNFSYVWNDTNGNGLIDGAEAVTGGTSLGSVNNWSVDANGDIWVLGDSSISRYAVTMVNGRPTYTTTPTNTYAKPAAFSQKMSHLKYNAATDTMFIGGYSTGNPQPSGEQPGGVGTILARYNNWRTNGGGTSQAWLVNAPTESWRYNTTTFSTSSGAAMDVAMTTATGEGYIFITLPHTTDTAVLNVNTGQLADRFRPGPEVSTSSAWIDYNCALQAIRRSDGEYMIVVEDDGAAKNMVYRWHPTDTLPAGWSSSAIGYPDQAGYAVRSGSTWTVAGNGDDIWFNRDQFRFASQAATGDQQIVARVASMDNTDALARAGVMYRDSTAADAPFAMAAVTPSSGLVFEWRSTVGGAVSRTQVSGAAPRWVKISRVGSSFRALYSSDGTNWTQLGSAQTITMASTAQAGLAVTSRNVSALCKAQFDSVTVSAAIVPPASPTALTATAVSASQINLAWTDNATNESGYRVERKTGAGGTYAVIATTAANANSYSDSTVAASTQYYYRVIANNAGGDSAYSNEANATTPSSFAGLMYDGFNYTVGANLAGLNGGLGWAGNSWTFTDSAAKYTATIDNGLTFSDLQTTGGSLKISSTAPSSLWWASSASRQIGTAPVVGSTLWESYLFQRGGPSTSWAANEMKQGVSDLATDATTLRLQSNAKSQWNYPGGGVGYNTSGARDDSPTISDGNEYLLISRYTNVGNAAGGQAKWWALTTAQFDAVKGGGILETELDANCTATATHTVTGASAMLTSDFVQFYSRRQTGSNTELTYNVDELRYGSTADEVTPNGGGMLMAAMASSTANSANTSRSKTKLGRSNGTKISTARLSAALFQTRTPINLFNEADLESERLKKRIAGQSSSVEVDLLK